MSIEEPRGSTPKVVLVTGASMFHGAYLVTRLAHDERIERVIAVDAKTPSKDLLRRMGRAEFVRADIRNPLISKVIAGNEVDTVVHSATLSRPQKAGSRTAMKDSNVLGAMQLFAACQKAPSLRKVVVRSSVSVYGSSAKDPVKFTEDMGARRPPRGAFARDTIEVEGFARGLARRRPDIAISVLRLAPTVGPQLLGSAVRYVTSPLVPSVLGRDARIQLLHEEDALAALEHSTVAGAAGTFNVAGDGVLMLSQAIRRAGRVETPMPFPLFSNVGRMLMGPVMREFTAEQMDYFQFGCVVDTTRMRTVLGFEPRWTTSQAFDDFVKGAALRPVIKPDWIDSVEAGLLNLVGARAGTQ